MLLPGRSRRRLLGYLRLGWMVAAILTIAAISCGESYNNTPQPTSSPSVSPANGVAMEEIKKLMTVVNGELGTILADGSGRTLYMYTMDAPNESKCTGGCASAWPPYTTTSLPGTAEGVASAMVGTITRTDGSKQVTYNQHPLYYYSGDRSTGDVNGQEVGDVWYAVTSKGDAADEEGTDASSAQTTPDYSY